MTGKLIAQEITDYLNDETICPECDKNTIKQGDRDGELVAKCSNCGFWMDWEIWKDRE